MGSDGTCLQYHVISCCCLVGKHVHLSFWFSASVYIYVLTSCGQHITPLPGNVSTGKIQRSRELQVICMQQQRVWLDMYTVTIARYRGRERETYMKSLSVSSLLSSLNMYRAFYSLSSMPLLLILSALCSSLGRVTG